MSASGGIKSFLIAETDFGLDMLHHAPADESVVVSPLSVIFALTMVQAGAKDNTKSQINKLISKDSSDSAILDYYSDLSQQITKAKNGVKSRIANGFFLNKDYKIEKDYGDVIGKKLSAKIESHDFSKADEAAKIINDFVSEVTAGKIPKLVDADSVNGAFSVIVNAIYFTAEWEHKFNRWGNSKEKFYNSEEKFREMDFMHHGMVRRDYAEDEDFQVLSLQYKDTSYAFNIFLPKKRFGLGELMKTLNGAKVQQLLSKLENTLVSIGIPKMKIETNYGLKEALLKMGATDMFSSKANLSGISKEPPLQITDATHKAIIEVDEEGTTAAAATAMMAAGSAFIQEEPKEFTADHPFLFFLTKDKNPLFMGHFM